MAGFRTYNQTNQPMWVTIYTVGGVFKEDWGNVDAGTYRDWNSGHYAYGSYYQIRGQWPTNNSTLDTDTTPGPTQNGLRRCREGQDARLGCGEYSSHSLLTVLAERETIASPQDRTLQAEPPAKDESLKTDRVFGTVGNGIAHMRLERENGIVVWTNVDGG